MCLLNSFKYSWFPFLPKPHPPLDFCVSLNGITFHSTAQVRRLGAVNTTPSVALEWDSLHLHCQFWSSRGHLLSSGLQYQLSVTSLFWMHSPNLGLQPLGCNAWWSEAGVWCSNNRSEVHNKCNALESSGKHAPPHPYMWKNFLPRNQSLVPKRLGTAALSRSDLCNRNIWWRCSSG